MSILVKNLATTIIDGSTSESNLQKILLNNRHVQEEQVEAFLSPPFPTLNINLSIASRLVNDAIKRNKQILIYGDYDADGITATAILWQSLYKIYPNVTPFIPNRINDGYGIKAESVFRFQKDKGIQFDLIITVDNGIVAGHEFSLIKAKQDSHFIVIDHHLPDKPLVDIDALIHTTSLSGSALSWFFAKEFDSDADMGLAALGTVADCLPITGTNRSLVVHGLQSLRLNPSPGIKKMIEVSQIKQNSISAYDLGFVLGPRINAVGRLSDPTDALRLLCSHNTIQATKYAHILNTFNRDRQSLQKDSLKLADNQVDTNKKLLFVSSPSFNPGIIGLIAGRLTEKYYLPSIVISSEGLISRGSCRSIPELNIVEILRKHSKLFLDLGGHALAAGFSIDTKNISKLKKVLMADIGKKLKGINLEPKIIVDAQMKLSAVTLKNITLIGKLSPFGIGNPEPLFLFSKLKVVSKKLLGSTADHLKLKLDDPDTLINENTPARLNALAFGVDAIAFKKGELDKDLNVGDLIDIVASLSANTWNGTTTPQLIVKEIIKNT